MIHSSSQQTFSSAVGTRAEQRANTRYSLDHVSSKDFWVICEGRGARGGGVLVNNSDIGCMWLRR